MNRTRVVWALTLVVIAGLMSVAENRVLWGYWLSRPSLAPEIADASVTGLSVLPLEGVERADRNQYFTLARRFCAPPSNECLEGSLLVALGTRADHAPEVDGELLKRWWSDHVERPGSLATVSDPRYRASSLPVGGIAIHYRRVGDAYLLFAYRTSEIANDRYMYLEALYRILGSEPILVRQNRFFYEIAGIEGLEWPVLWPLNFFCIAFASVVVMLIRRPRLGNP